MRVFRFPLLIALFSVVIAGGLACSQTNQKTTTTAPKTTTGIVKIGDGAPDFEMRNQDQIKVSLSEFKGKKNVVLMFYPADFTPV